MKRLIFIGLIFLLLIGITSANTPRQAVVIGDSIAHGLPAFGRIETGPALNTSYLPAGGGVSYDSEMQWNYTPVAEWDWRYNMGLPGDSTSGTRARWLRDAIGQTVYVGDGLPNTTLPGQPDLILLDVGINDIWGNIPLSTIEENIFYCVNDANARGIPIIVMAVFPNASHSSQITVLDSWEAATFVNNASMPYVRWIDGYGLLNDGNGNIRADLTIGDSVHPNEAGYFFLTDAIYTENLDLFTTPQQTWQSWTQTYYHDGGVPTSLTTISAQYVEYGKTVYYSDYFAFYGNTTATTDISASVPVTMDNSFIPIMPYYLADSTAGIITSVNYVVDGGYLRFFFLPVCPLNHICYVNGGGFYKAS